MIRHIYLLALAVCTLGFALPSCKQQDDIEETTLLVSTETLSFTKEAATQEVTVQTSAESWSYLSPQEFSWFTLSQSGNKLQVQVQENTLGQERTGVIAITAGGQQRRVLVKQAAGDFTLDVEPALVTFPQEGGKKTVSFHANGQGVKAELADESTWLTIEQGRDLLTLTAQPSTDKHKRQTKVNVQIGSLIREITVEQEGTVSYLLPTLQFPASAAEVIRFEQARGSVLIQTPIEILQINSYRFLTKNPNIPTVEYSYHKEGNKGFYRAMVISPNRELFEDNPDFAAFLDEQGFKKVSENKSAEETRITYSKDGSPYQLTALYGDGGVGLEFLYIGKQDKEYKTFAELPMKLQISRTGSPSMKILGASREDIRKYEDELKSTLDESVGVKAYDRFYVAEGKDIEGEYIRGYFFSEVSKEVPEDSPYLNHLEGSQALYKNPSLAFYADAFGERHLTREVTKLFTDAGYPYLRKLANGREVFYSQRDKIAYVLTNARIAKEDVLEIQALRIDLGLPSSIKRKLNYKTHLLDEQRQEALLTRALARHRHR